MRAYHFLSADNAIDDIQHRRLKISRIADLNDPFELLALELTDKRVREVSLNTREILDANRGVLCFSKNWNNPVLWSHYADKHKGICLGFDLSDSVVMEVEYDGCRLAHDLRGAQAASGVDEKFMHRILSTKYKDWEYEDEVRVFAELADRDEKSGFYFADFGDTLQLREVIFGARLEPSKKQIKDIISSVDSNVRLIQGRLAFTSFKIVEYQMKTKGLPNQKMHRTR